ncbi:hypothetical protein [Neobacillus terrae]|nr:hypothetical protein [Neobacillus terrae]NHM31581.1 hypothetical protein [Neobacillus terrae]
MADNFENLMFIRELGRLMSDYRNCNDNDIKRAIYKDIELLGKALNY